MAQDNKNKVLNVPPLRFPEFIEPWDIAFLENYLVENKERNKNGDFTKNDVLSVSGEQGVVNQIELLGRSFAGKSVIPYHIARHNNIIYTKSPLSDFPYGIVKMNRGVDGIVSTLYAVYNVLPNADASFVEFYFALKHRANRYFKPIVRIGAKHDMKIGNAEVLHNLVKFPQIEEQQRISAFLELIDERIATQNKIIEKLQSLIKGLVDETIDSLDCEFIKFADIYLEAKEGGTPSTSVREYYERGTVPFIKIDDLTNKYLSSNKDYITELGMHKSSAWLIPAGSIIFSNGATIGAVSISTYPVTTKQGILGIVPKNNIDVEYLYYLLNSTYFTKEVERIVTEGTMRTAYLKDINKIMCPIPNLPIQNQISKLLSSYSQKLRYEQHILDCYDCQKQYLLSQMFM